MAIGATVVLTYDRWTSSALVKDSIVVLASSSTKNVTIPVGIRFRI